MNLGNKTEGDDLRLIEVIFGESFRSSTASRFGNRCRQEKPANQENAASLHVCRLTSGRSAAGPLAGWLGAPEFNAR